jgi:hypothetical protein
MSGFIMRVDFQARTKIHVPQEFFLHVEIEPSGCINVKELCRNASSSSDGLFEDDLTATGGTCRLDKLGKD